MGRGTADPLVRDLYLCRTMAGITIKELCKKSGLSPSTISDAELGYHSPTLATLRIWSLALGMDIGLTTPE